MDDADAVVLGDDGADGTFERLGRSGRGDEDSGREECRCGCGDAWCNQRRTLLDHRTGWAIR